MRAALPPPKVDQRGGRGSDLSPVFLAIHADAGFVALFQTEWICGAGQGGGGTDGAVFGMGRGELAAAAGGERDRDFSVRECFHGGSRSGDDPGRVVEGDGDGEIPAMRGFDVHP